MRWQRQFGAILALVTALLAQGSATAATPGAKSWAYAAAGGGNLVRVSVLDGGRVAVEADLCRADARMAPTDLAPVWTLAAAPAAGSSVLGILRKTDERLELAVPALGWTRWSLDLSPAYLDAVCRRAAGESSDAALRAAWMELVRTTDQRARDEASRLAVEQPGWAATLTDAELTDLIQALTVFPVPEAEAERWVAFLLGLPPGDQLLAVLRAAEGSSRPFFERFMATVRVRLWSKESFRAFCAILPLRERPGACPPLPETPNARRPAER